MGTYHDRGDSDSQRRQDDCVILYERQSGSVAIILTSQFHHFIATAQQARSFFP